MLLSTEKSKTVKPSTPKFKNGVSVANEFRAYMDYEPLGGADLPLIKKPSALSKPSSFISVTRPFGFN
jgi:hypothetical protein